MNPLTIQGETNPALCAMKALRSAYSGVPIDEESFKQVADGIKLPVEDVSLVINSIDDIITLCELGDFVICFNDGKLTCVPVLGRMKV